MSTTIDENALADYEALCAGATAGPWEIEREELGEDFDDEEQDTAFPMTIGPIQLWEHALDNLTDEHGAQVETDAAFIAQSRTMGPLLATKVREQAKEIERLQRLAREGWKEVQDTCDFEGVEVPGRVSAALAEIGGGA